MTRIRHVAVVVPACDEQDTIGACLASVRLACAALRSERPDVSTSVTVVLDACTDGTAAVASAAGVDLVTSTARCVGSARRTGTRHAIAGATCAGHQVWTAHTDADSLVPTNWLLRQVALGEAGNDLVLGTVEPELPPAQLARWQALHDPRDGHPHVHGANLGIAAGALTALGGWRELRSGEDVDLVARAALAGRAIARVGASPVRTSARLHARAPLGFSSFLRSLDAFPPDASRGTAEGQAVDAPRSA